MPAGGFQQDQVRGLGSGPGEFGQVEPEARFGGDAYRIWDGSRQSKSLVRSSAIVIVERMSGILILFLFALLASLLRLDMVRRVPLIAASLGRTNFPHCQPKYCAIE